MPFREGKFLNIVVTGIGYVGIVTAVCMADMGHKIICVDSDESKIDKLKSGKPVLFEPNVFELMEKNKGRLIYTTDYKQAYKNADIIFICVGTPERRDGYANLSYVYEVSNQIAESAENETVVAVKSTVPIGTCSKVDQHINSVSKHKIYVASNPEFLSQGTAVKDTFKPERIVIGVNSDKCLKIMKAVYKGFEEKLLITDIESSEMIKYASNDFLALKISYINEIANLCEIVGANIDDVASGMGLDSRIGNKFLNAGIGYGGSCFPKDTKALHWLSKYHDFELKTVKAAIEVNENQKIKLIKKARKYYKSFRGLNIAVLGLTFKPNTDDLREAPSLENVPLLLDDGANVRVWDKFGMDNFKKFSCNQITYCETIESAIENTDICFIFTEWDDIKQFPLCKYEELMKNPIILDGRNCYNLDDVKKVNIIYNSIGRPVIKQL